MEMSVKNKNINFFFNCNQKSVERLISKPVGNNMAELSY